MTANDKMRLTLLHWRKASLTALREWPQWSARQHHKSS